MAHKHSFEALDRTFRDVMRLENASNEDILFGNKVILFGGDFRQILPVVRKGNRARIINASLKKSIFWNKIRVLRLKKNMRVYSNTGLDSLKAKEFSEYLLKIGEGKEWKLKDPSSDGFDDYINVPKNLVNHFDIEKLIKTIYPSLDTK